MRILFIVLLVLASGCDLTSDYPASAEDSEGATAIAEKASRTEKVETYDLSTEEPWIECHGELMQFHGVLQIHITEVETPSGNLLVRGWVEYPEDGYAIGTESGNRWERRKGLNPYTETLRGEWYSEEDFWAQSWQIIEWYTSDEHGKFKVHWWGTFHVDDEGNVMVYRDNLTCR